MPKQKVMPLKFWLLRTLRKPHVCRSSVKMKHVYNRWRSKMFWSEDVTRNFAKRQRLDWFPVVQAQRCVGSKYVFIICFHFCPSDGNSKVFWRIAWVRDVNQWLLGGLDWCFILLSLVPRLLWTMFIRNSHIHSLKHLGKALVIDKENILH